MSATPSLAFRSSTLGSGSSGRRLPLLAPGAWLESRVACPPPLLTRLGAVLDGSATGAAPMVRADLRRPGLYDLTLDGWAICVLIYPGGRGARVLAAVRLGAPRET
ncbi:MAG: hypothetical protein MUC67_08805 [Acidobacteria bacterium]|nr:hypothetical protein [Acidobacteriota bacterium]